jgi:nicotinamide-nucleotide amidase
MVASKVSSLWAEVLTIGDELNRGEIVDSNSSWLAEQLTALGAHVRWRTSVTDDEPDMVDALERAAARARVVVATGGLGPTDDDRTVDVVARLLGVAAAEETAHKDRMVARFTERNFPITPNNLRQVRTPGGADTLENRKGLAPGFRVKLGGADFFFMPGVPREMKPMFEHQVVPRLATLTGAAAKVARRTFRVMGLGESHVDHALRGLMDGASDSTLHFRIAYPETLVTLVVRRGSEDDAQAELARLEREVRARLGENIYGTDGESLPQVVGRRLRERGATLATAESCTGGMLGQLITQVAGSSDYYKGGVVSYANEIKTGLLGVSDDTLMKHGAVSEATVREMAAGAQKSLATTYALSISGIAGPGGGTPDKPVGTVWIGLATPEGTTARHLHWPGDREQVRTIASFGALHFLHKTLTR